MGTTVARNMQTAAFQAWLNRAGYAGVFVAMLMGNLGVPALGSAAIVLMLPFLVSPEWWIAALIATAGETTGQFVQYGVARFGAASLLSRFERQAGPGTRHRSRFEEFYRRYGNEAVLICRFIPGVKALSGIPAGAARMPMAPFVLYTLLGASISCFCIAWVLHAVGGHSPLAAGYARRHGLLLFVLLVSCLLLFAVLKKAVGKKTRR